ncbi:MAG TPA: hypothetical protein VFL79_08515, partial [Terriglobia bacterium]|nr:hypothetical protein [Terriglobia bacterium]
MGNPMNNLTESDVFTGVPGSERIAQDSQKAASHSLVKLSVGHLDFYYGPRQVLFDVSLNIS